MKNLLIIISVFSVFACQSTTEKKEQKQTPLLVTESVTTENETILLGQINRANLLTTPYTQWFIKEYDFYTVPTGWAANLKSKMEGVSIKIFMGTWCEDTQRELGGMFKLLDALEFDESTLDMYSLSEYKDSPSGIEKTYNITNIPTLIFFKNGVEMNRIVEISVSTLDIDIAKILMEEPYKNAYYQE